MGYTDITVRVYVDVLGPLYVVPGPEIYSIRLYLVWDTQAEAVP